MMNNTKKNTLKEAFDSYEIKPSEGLWEKTYDGLQKEAAAGSAGTGARRVLYFAGAGAIMIAAVLYFALSKPQTENTVKADQIVSESQINQTPIADNSTSRRDTDPNTMDVKKKDQEVEDNLNTSIPIVSSQLKPDNPSATNTIQSTTSNKKSDAPNAKTDNTNNIYSNPVSTTGNHLISNTKENPVIDKTVQVSSDTSVCIGEYAVLKAVGGNAVKWNNGEKLRRIMVMPEKTTTYTVTYTFADNSTIDKSVTVKVRPCLYIPNAFAPNSIGKSRLFKPEGTEINDFSMQIYSRQGVKVFETSDINQGWDGNINGTPAPDQIYVYVITFRDAFAYPHVRKGTVTIVK
jgi:gliding motility-associated-like protein